MKWNSILDNWKNNKYYKYPTYVKKKFMWNTSVIKDNGNSNFKEKFKIEDNLPEQQNFKAFESYINKSKSKYVTSFLNLDKDTLLIIPIPKKNKNYATLKDFCDNSSITQKKYFWKKVSKLVKKFMKNEKYVWISTHGLGVSYMHIRISNKPKYYFDNELKKI